MNFSADIFLTTDGSSPSTPFELVTSVTSDLGFTSSNSSSFNITSSNTTPSYTASWNVTSCNETSSNATSPRAMSVVDTVFVIVVSTASCLSIPSCVAIIAMHVMWPDLRTAGRSMLLQLSVADLLTAVGNLMGVLWFLHRDVLSKSKAYCDMHSSLTIFSSIASFFWTTVTAMSLYLVLVRQAYKTAQSYWIPIWLCCWGVPAVIGTTALAMDVLGYDPNITQASWCWISPKTKHQEVWNFITGKAWELIAYFLTVVLYTAVRVSLLRQKAANDAVLTSRSRQGRLRDANVKLMFVPLIFILLRLWGTVRFLLGLIDYSVANSPYAAWIVPLQGFGDTAQGFCNFVMDVMCTEKVRRHLRHICSNNPQENDSSRIWTSSKSSGSHP